MISPWRKWRFHVHGDLMDKYWYMWLIMDSMIVGAANWWKTWRIDCISKKWWTNRELTLFSVGGIHQEIELAVPIVVVWVQTSRTHLDRSSLFPSLVTPLRKSSSLLKYVPQKNCQCIIAGDLGPSETAAQPLLLGFSCHGGLCVSWARDSEDPGAKTQAPSHHFTNHQPWSITWGTLFFRPHQGSQPRKKRFQAPSPWKMRLPPGLAHESSQSKSCMVDTCMSKNPCLWFKFHQYTIMFRKDIHRYPWYVKKT